MKKISAKKWIAALLVSTMAFTLTGCGEELYEMTDEERQIVVDYSAHIIAKYNTRQPEGYMYVYEEEPEEEEDFSEFGEDDTSVEDENQDESGAEVEEEDASDDARPSGDSSENSDSSGKYVSLSEALGLNTLNAEFMGAQYSLKYDTFVPEYGCGMCVVTVRINNPKNKDINLDMLSRIPTFKAQINDAVNLKASLTILLDDLSTFQGVVPANGSVDTVILFQFKDDKIVEINSLKLSVDMDGETKIVDLM